MRIRILTIICFGLSSIALAEPFQVHVLPALNLGFASAGRPINGEPVEQGKPRFSLVGGVYAELPLSYTFGLVSGLEFAKYGGSARGIFNLNTRLHMDSLQVPLLLKVYLNRRGPRFFLMGGPAVGFIYGKNLQIAETFQFDSGLKSTDFLVQFGAGVTFRLSRKVAGTFGLRYNAGLINLSENLGVFKSRSISALMGLTFPL